MLSALGRLERAPEPSPELRKELYPFDIEYRHGSEEKFAELEKRADDLAKQFPAKDDQARIWYEVAHVAAQSNIHKQAERVKKYASKCLAISRDPLQRPIMYGYLASTVDVKGAAFAEGRREAAKILLAGYVEMLAQELPEEAPDLPAVGILRHHRRSYRRSPSALPTSTANGCASTSRVHPRLGSSPRYSGNAIP